MSNNARKIREKGVSEMAKSKVDRSIYKEVTHDEDGAVTAQKEVVRMADEPDFVKLYIDCVFTVKGVRKGINPIFLAFLEHMSYADINTKYGGQVIYVNKAMKSAIAEKLGLKIDSINKALSELVRSGIFKRVETGTYQVNPNIIGRGQWTDIKNIRAIFDFKNREIMADIIHEDEEKEEKKGRKAMPTEDEPAPGQMAFDNA
jgi:predicted transcriptional regulator